MVDKSLGFNPSTSQVRAGIESFDVPESHSIDARSKTKAKERMKWILFNDLTHISLC